MSHPADADQYIRCSNDAEAQGAHLQAKKAQVLRGIDPSKKAQTVYPGQVGDKITLAAFAEL